MAVADTGLDSEDVIRRRLDTARREIENYSKYDYVLVNNVLEQSADQLTGHSTCGTLAAQRGRDFRRRQAASGSGASLPVGTGARVGAANLASFNLQMVKGT